MTLQALPDRYVGHTLPRLAGRSAGSFSGEPQTCRFCRLRGTSCLWRVCGGHYSRSAKRVHHRPCKSPPFTYAADQSQSSFGGREYLLADVARPQGQRP
jgi:hypothetical protein